jgi:predicted GNAT family acetyltransferase
MNAEVRNNPAEYRYELWADGQLAGFSQYVRRPERIAFLHTEIHEPYEGLGLGGRLARAALDDARARGLLVMPFCPFIAAFIERHPMSTVTLWPLRCSQERDYERQGSPGRYRQRTRRRRVDDL